MIDNVASGPGQSHTTALRLFIVMAVAPLIFMGVAASLRYGTNAGPTVLAGEAVDLTCINPVPDALPLCEAMAQRILDSTVRLMLLGTGPVIIGHGTVVGGRYVITHNHYAPDWPGASGQPGLITHFSLALASGEFIVRNAPLSDFSIAVEEPGMLLDFGADSGRGFFERRGIPSAPLVLWDKALLQPGREVAQVNWDGATSYVTWARVANVRDAASGAAFEVENFIELGASGGGVFLNGYHVANNWLQGRLFLKDTHELTRQYSVATANTAVELGPIAAASPSN